MEEQIAYYCGSNAVIRGCFFSLYVRMYVEVNQLN